MFKKLFLVLFVLLFSTISFGQKIAYSDDEWSYNEYSDYVSAKGDYFVADLENGVGYLVNDDEKYFTFFPLLSGQRTNVCYIGRCYYAATPEQEWVVKENNIQTDRITFSDDGTFLRLYANGEERTSYGIHGHAYFEEMLATGGKFKSMGCLIVSDDALDVIEKSFLVNENTLNVSTFHELSLSSLLFLKQ
jgi:hypothetical protein